MKKQADIVAVARAAKVSISTVSRRFNHPDLVNPTTRKRIDRAVERLGYIRNRAAQAMHGRRSGTIGLIVPTIDHAIFAEVIQSFSEAVEAEGFTILMASHGYDLDREYSVLRKLLEHRVDAVALIGLEHSDKTHLLIEEQGVPALAIWNYASSSRLSCVGTPNHAAGRLAAEHLLSLGHRRIGLAFPPVHGNDRASERLSGARSALDRAGVVPTDHLETPYSVTQAKSACAALFERSDAPTALLCGNDVIAQGAIFAAQRARVAVPDQISIMGIGDFKGSDALEPGLSTIRIPARAIGAQAGESLVQLLTGAQDGPLRHAFEPVVVPRGSTAPLLQV